MASCVDCSTNLVPIEHEGRSIRGCPACGGIFIEHAALTAVAKDARAPRSETERAEAVARATGRHDGAGDAVRRCPTCSRYLRRHVYAFSSGVLVDSCDDHGFWLDAGELARIEAWSEATAHGTQQPVDVIAAQTTTIAAPGPRGVTLGELEVHARTLAAFGMVEPAAALTVGGMVVDTVRAKRATRAGVADATLLARAGAEADQVPSGADAIACRVELTIPAHADEVWPKLFRIELLATWMLGLESARVVSGIGSSRVQELTFAGAHVVRQRVTRVDAGRAVTWRDEAEIPRGFDVTAWHGGCWCELEVQPWEGAARVSWSATYVARDSTDRARIDERLTALQAWMSASLDVLGSEHR